MAYNPKTTLFVASYVACLGLFAYLGYEYADYKMHKATGGAAVSSQVAAEPSYVELRPLNLTIASSTGVNGRIRMDISLEVDRRNRKALEDYLPTITERIVNYTRTLDFAEVSKPKAPDWLKLEFLHVANKSAPVPVSDVTFRQFLVI